MFKTMKAALLAALLSLAYFGAALAQGTGGNMSITATSTSSVAALPTANPQFQQMLIVPAAGSTGEVFYKLGDNTAVAVANTDKAVPGGGICISRGSNTFIAAVTSGAVVTLRITMMASCPQFSGIGTGLPVTASMSSRVPAAIGWDTVNYPIAPSIVYTSGEASVGSAGITPQALFDRFSTARSAPGASFWVAATGGSDANNCLTQGASCNTIGHAVQLCNAAAVPCTIFVQNGTYYKGQSFTNFGTVFPTVDIAFIATGGSRSIVCHCDAFAAPSKDGTFTNTYSYAVTSVERVVDTSRRDAYGNYVEMTNASTAANVNVTPNSWALVAGTIYIQRYDGSAVLNTNTRVYRSTGGANVYLNNATQTSLYVGGATAADGFDIEGGSDGFKTNFTTYVAALDAVVFSNSSLKYGGGVGTPTGNCASARSFNGIVAFFNVQASACASDGFNGHNDLTLTGGTAAVSMLTVNSAAFDNGRGTSQTNNGWTIHDDVKGFDIAGWYWGNHGGTVRDVNASKAYLFGTMVQMDFGDIANGGVQIPTAYRVDDTAVMYLESVQMQMPAATWGLYATSSASIFVKNSAIGRQPNAGAGTFGTF